MKKYNMTRKYRYGDKPIRTITVEIVADIFQGSATSAQVDAYLKGEIPDYIDNTYANLVVNSVNCNRGHWSFNKTARRTDDVTHRHHQYDRLYKRGKVFEIYQPSIHGVFEIYQSANGKWLTREVNTEFEEQIELASKLTPEQRRQKISSECSTPEMAVVTTRVFKRSAYVVAEVLSLANGVCQGCNNEAPFKREDGTPYLEVHHVDWLSKGGEDTVENAIALCPNCHRQAHYGNLELTKVNKLK